MLTADTPNLTSTTWSEFVEIAKSLVSDLCHSQLLVKIKGNPNQGKTWLQFYSTWCLKFKQFMSLSFKFLGLYFFFSWSKPADKFLYYFSLFIWCILIIYTVQPLGCEQHWECRSSFVQKRFCSREISFLYYWYNEGKR